MFWNDPRYEESDNLWYSVAIVDLDPWLRRSNTEKVKNKVTNVLCVYRG